MADVQVHCVEKGGGYPTVSLSEPCLSFLVWDFACLSLEVIIELLSFLFLFSGYFSITYACVVCIVSGDFYQSSSELFNVVFESFYRCIDANLNLVTPLPSSFLDTYTLSTSSLACKALCIFFSFLVFWSICWSSFHVLFKNGFEYLIRVTA